MEKNRFFHCIICNKTFKAKGAHLTSFEHKARAEARREVRAAQQQEADLLRALEAEHAQRQHAQAQHGLAGAEEEDLVQSELESLAASQRFVRELEAELELSDEEQDMPSLPASLGMHGVANIVLARQIRSCAAASIIVNWSRRPFNPRTTPPYPKKPCKPNVGRLVFLFTRNCPCAPSHPRAPAHIRTPNTQPHADTHTHTRILTLALNLDASNAYLPVCREAIHLWTIEEYLAP